MDASRWQTQKRGSLSASRSVSQKPKQSGVAAQLVNDDVRVAFWLGLALFFLYLLTTPAHQPYGDEEKYLAVAENIPTRGSPALTSTQPGVDGQLHDVITYSKFALGQDRKSVV